MEPIELQFSPAKEHTVHIPGPSLFLHVTHTYCRHSLCLVLSYMLAREWPRGRPILSFLELTVWQEEGLEQQMQAPILKPPGHRKRNFPGFSVTELIFHFEAPFFQGPET